MSERRNFQQQQRVYHTCADGYTRARCEIGKYISQPPYLTLKQQIYESVNM